MEDDEPSAARSPLGIGLLRDRAASPRALALQAVAIGLLAVVYFVGARIGFAFALVEGNASPIWPPAGIAVGALLYGGRRLWPGVFLGALFVNLANGASPIGSAFAAVGALIEPLLAVAILRRTRFRPQLDRLVDVPILAFGGAALPAAVAATIGVLGLTASGSIMPANAPLAWAAWWIGDALSILIVGGLMVTWLWPQTHNPLQDRPVETVVAIGSVVGVSILFFFDLFNLRASGQSVAFPIFPLIVWIAFRVGPRGTALASLAFSVIAIAATEQDLGPFVGTTSEKSLLYLSVFIVLVASSGAAVAAIVAERDADRRTLASSIDRAATELRQLQALESIGQTLAEQGPTPEALESVVGALADVFGYSHPSIYQGDERMLRIGAQRGYESIISEFDGTSGILARVMRTKETEFLPDVSVDPDFIRADPGIRSEIAAPLLSHGAFLGVLNVESRRPLDERDLAAVSVVADRVAAAMALALERNRMAELAVRDGLTGLYNRRYLDETLRQLAAARAREREATTAPLAVIMFDLDRFGDFNKHHGHQVGDEALKAFAQILHGRFRGSDVLARYGGEEFIAVLPGARVDDAVRVAEAIRGELASTSIAGSDGEPLSVTVSAGCAGSDDPKVMPAELIRGADVGLAMAKRGGRDRVVAA